MTSEICNKTSMTVQFLYSYKDMQGNEKSSLLNFSTNNSLDAKEETEFIRSLLIEKRWFYASDLCIPELFFEDFNPSLDLGWHEFLEIKTNPSPGREVHERWEDFLERLIELQFEYNRVRE